MNHTQRWLAVVRPRHNPAENALIPYARRSEYPMVEQPSGNAALRAPALAA
jgi:hypothetical protein